MLALMPRSSPLPDFQKPCSSTASSTMSVALLPSAPKSYDQTPARVPQLQTPSPSKRPKLSLNTSDVAPIIGKSSTSLRLETLSATSPTARNTFSNRRDVDRTSSVKPKRPALTPLATVNTVVSSPEALMPSRIELPNSAESPDGSASSAASITSTSTLDSLPSEIPYKLPFNATSILSNGPIRRTRSLRSPFAQSKPLFPAPKRVSFRTQLTEEIKTVRYTLKHSDIESPLPSSEDSETTPSLDQDQEDPAVEHSVELSTPTAVEPSSRDEDDSDTCPATPVAGKRKRDRQWVWTLGPIQPADPDVTSEPSVATEEAETSADR